MQIEVPRSLLVLKPSSFGDIVHTLPAVSRLKKAWPDCRISWLVNIEWVPLLAGNPDVDEIIKFPRREFRGWGGGWKFAKWMRSQIVDRKPDLALDFQGLLRSAFIGRASGTRRLMGLSDAREGARLLYHRVVRSPAQPAHAIDRYLKLGDTALRSAGLDGASCLDASPDFPLPTGEPPGAAFEAEDRYVVIHPYARGKDKSIDVWAIDQLISSIRNKRIVLVGRGFSEIPLLPERCTNLLNQTSLPQLIWLIRHASFVISVDSGPAHVAAALGKRMVAIHSWSDPRKVGPYSPDAWVWKNGTLTRVRHLASMTADFFAPRPLRLRETDVEAIAALATSPSDFFA